MTESLFAGLKVIDCASWIAGPAAATILSDFGADVIKIEPPGAGDPWRASTPVPGKTTDYYWQLTSRNKRSLAIDLKHADGLAVLYRLLASADVFVTNFPLPVRERLKIAAAHVLPLNPRLIYASFSAYGEVGEEAGRTGFDSTAYWARTGLMDMVRATEDTEPARSVPGMGDHPSATGLYAAIVTALYRREKTGKGGVVQSSLLQNGLWANACFVQSRLFGEHVPHRAPRAEAPNPLWPTIIAAATAAGSSWRCSTSSGSCAASWPRSAARTWPTIRVSRRARRASRTPARWLRSWMRSSRSGTWRSGATILHAAGVTFGGGALGERDRRRSAVPTDRRARALCRWEGPDRVEPLSSRRRDARWRRGAPRRSGSTPTRCCGEAGYSAGEIERLRALGVLG